MARNAVESRLSGHLAEPDFGADVTTRLPARRIDRHEAMDFEAVTGGALHVAQRAGIGLEVDAMSRGGRDPFPFVFLFVSLHVTRRADARRDLRVHRDLFGTIRDPEIELPRAREDRLLMTVMAAEGVVLGAGEALKRALHDVAAGAERVVVLHVIPAD